MTIETSLPCPNLSPTYVRTFSSRPQVPPLDRNNTALLLPMWSNCRFGRVGPSTDSRPAAIAPLPPLWFEVESQQTEQQLRLAGPCVHDTQPQHALHTVANREEKVRQYHQETSTSRIPSGLELLSTVSSSSSRLREDRSSHLVSSDWAGARVNHDDICMPVVSPIPQLHHPTTLLLQEPSLQRLSAPPLRDLPAPQIARLLLGSSPPLVIGTSLRHCHSLPCKLSCPNDAAYLTKFQVFLRLNIEAFCASVDDVGPYKQGRNKRVRLGQVGIRCRHCAHVPSSGRTKGAVYFPVTTLGFYQAAQNMSSTHLQCGACPEMPPSIQAMFTELLSTKTSSNHSKVGSKFWKECVERDLGLINTEHGVFVGGPY